ncbi:hypothetical protein BDF22DRAFT_689162 [Syncephalis plumigaleata]|nr:hypothetical protein BDF22DRAFT_689162 [Syncephalis plumigaleata]
MSTEEHSNTNKEVDVSTTAMATSTPIDSLVSGQIPSTELFSIEYPGYVRNMDKVLETLGGIDTITQNIRNVATEQTTRQSLNMRPQGMDYVSTPKLLLRVRRQKQHSETTSNTTSNQAESFDATVVGRIKQTCRFRSEYLLQEDVYVVDFLTLMMFLALSDFQYNVDPQHPMVKLCQSLESGDGKWRGDTSYSLIIVSVITYAMILVAAIREFKFDYTSQLDSTKASIPPPFFSRIEVASKARPKARWQTAYAETHVIPFTASDILV